MVILFPGPSDTLDQFLDQARNQTEGSPVLPFTLVLDKDFAITDQLDIRGDLAKPSSYILDKKGDLVYAYVGVSFTDRPSIKALLAQLDGLDYPEAKLPDSSLIYVFVCRQCFEVSAELQCM